MSKSQPVKIPASDQAWDGGQLGRNAAHSMRVNLSPAQMSKQDEKLGLEMISIRLPKELLADLKAIARTNGLGYQPLVRQVLTRFAHAELKAYAREALAAERASSPASTSSPETKSRKVA